MAEFIVNPRRAVRAPARCRTAVVSPAALFEAETEDIGARGCHVVSPKGVRQGDVVRVTIANDKLAEPLRVTGRVAWVSANFPWHVGIAFDEAALPETTAWFERLVEAHPGMKTLKRLPERISVEAMVWLGPPPRFVLDFSADEAVLLRTVGNGARVDDLLLRFRGREPAGEHALFSLIARGAVTLVRGNAVHPSAWKKVLDEVEASIAVDGLASAPEAIAAPEDVRVPAPRAATPPPRAATPAPGAGGRLATPAPGADPSGFAAAPPAAVRRHGGRGTPPPDTYPPAFSPFGTPPFDPSFPPVAAIEATGGLRIEIEEPTPAATHPQATPVPALAPRAPDHSGAGVGWRKGAGRRSGEAQALLDRGHAELVAGNVNGAIALVRRALAHAPGDPEIAEILGKLAFRDRDPGAR